MKNARRKLFAGLIVLVALVRAQSPLEGLMIGEGIPPELDLMYRSALTYLAATQTAQGNWQDNYGAQPGVVGICALAFLASGEDPNFGPYRTNVRRAAEFIVSQQDPATGYIGNSMYNHGFATLALAELYGHLREPDLSEPLRRAVDLILKSQEQNPSGAWRYSPVAKDADTTVSGAQMVALFAARNAGLEVPDKAFENGLAFFRKCIEASGAVGYTNAGGGNSTRTAIASLSFSLYNDHESEPARKTLDFALKNRDGSGGYLHYHFYYLAQALFQGNMDEWRAWNRKMVELFKATQQEDGSWNGQHGVAFTTAASLLTMALNYRMMPIYER